MKSGDTRTLMWLMYRYSQWRSLS